MKSSTMCVVLAGVLTGGEAHSRWRCPTPRDYGATKFDNTGNKHGPCGPLSGADYWGKNGVTALKPGPLTVTWEESISHVGAPWRISILDESGTSVAVLLDHIPHWDASRPQYLNESSYIPYSITLDIPDISCPKCTLQLLNIMTDKTTLCNITMCTYYVDDTECSGRLEAGEKKCLGASSAEPCRRADTCFSSYHSCADVTISGKVAAKDAVVKQPTDWVYRNLTTGIYTRETASWEDGWLKGLLTKYITPTGACPAPSAPATAISAPAQRIAALRGGEE